MRAEVLTKKIGFFTMALVRSAQNRFRQSVLRRSQLDSLIPPEIVNDTFARLITEIASAVEVRAVLEIGASNGAGSTAALVAGMRAKSEKDLYCLELSRPRFASLAERYHSEQWVHCYNLPSVPLRSMPTEEDVANFYSAHPESPIQRYRLATVQRWLRQDIEYITRTPTRECGIDVVRRESGIDAFDLVLIDGSEFTGEAELNMLYGAQYILLDDTMTFKCHAARHRLMQDADYELLEEGPSCRNGFAAFKLR